MLLALVVIKCSNSTCFAQTTNSEVWVDEFDDNHNYWWAQPVDDYSVWKIEDSKYILDHSDETGWRTTYIPYYIKDNQNYAIELLMELNEVSETSEFGITWGRGSGDFHYLKILNDNAYEVGMFYKNEFREIVKGELPTPVKLNQELRLKVEQEGSRMRYYINDVLVLSTYARRLFGKEMGVYISGDVKVTLDRLEVRHPKYEIPHTSDYEEYELVHLGPEINTYTHDELSPLISADGTTLYFVRDEPNYADEEIDQDIFIAQGDGNGNWSKAKDAGAPLNDDSPNFVVGVAADNNRVYLGNTYEENSGGHQGVSQSTRTASGWSWPEEIVIQDFENKADEVNYSPSADGTVMMLSLVDKTSLGESDLYVSFKEADGSWTHPRNLGSTVNTPGDEITPWLAPDNRTLYFTTDGRLGYGLYDVYVTKRIGSGWKQWSTPKNLGPLVNTELDELYFSIAADGRSAFFSRYSYESSKEKPSVDIYMLQLKEEHDNHIVAGEATELALDMEQNYSSSLLNTAVAQKVSRDEMKPEPVVILKGKVVDESTGKALNAEIVYRDLQSGEVAGRAQSDPSTGEYTIVLPRGTAYGIQAKAEDHLSVQRNVAPPLGGDEVVTLTENLELVPIKKGAKMNLNNIFFEAGKSKLLEASSGELDDIARLLLHNKALKIKLVGHTSDKGDPAGLLNLSLERAKAVKTYLVKRGVESSRIEVEGKGMTAPAVPNNSEVNRKLNRRVEFIITDA